MSDPKPAPPPVPTIHEADLASGPSGAVLRGAEIDRATAVARRQLGGHVVVCGPDIRDTRALAQQVEASVGPYKRGVPHTRYAGPEALPHFQQTDDTHSGHTFYETPNRRARN